HGNISCVLLRDDWERGAAWPCGGSNHRKLGGQRMPLWNRQLGALGDGHHEYLVWRGQFDARQLHCIGWSRATGKYSTWGAGFWRGWSGIVRYVDLRPIVGFYRRPHGRPHSRVSRQEDRIARSQTVHALCAHLSADHSIFLRLVGGGALCPFLPK